MENKQNNEIIIKVEDLTVAYEDKPVLWDVELNVKKGVLMAIVGPNGAGKSTLIKAMLNLIKPVTGEVLFYNEKYSKVRNKIAYVPQRGSVDWDFPTTVFDVVEMGRYGKVGWLKRVSKIDKEKTKESIAKVGMEEFSDRQISQLSGGQQQRVFLARALVQEAEIYFMDEPFQGVDSKTEKSIIDILKKYAPTVSYAVDNSEGFDVIYFRLGGYYADHKVNDINKIIGSYKVDGGKLTSTGDDLDKIGTKVNGNDKLKWNNININNKDHDKDAAFAIATKYNGVQLGGSIDSMVGLFGYLSDVSRHVKGAQLGMNVVPMSLGEITDIYNTAFPETFSAEQVYKKVTGIQHAKYREVDDSYKGNEDKYNKSVGNGEVVYFKKDKMYLAVIGGLGGVNAISPATPDKYTIEGDKVIVPLIDNFNGGKQKGQMVLRLNNKKYEGGQSKFKYYVESISK